MNLLQPWVLYATPLIALPVLLHLIHRRRHRVVHWGAMMFLLESSRLSRGRQVLRQIMILLMRTLAVAGLVFAIGRPIAGGWIGRMGGAQPDAVIVILDRSASMNMRPAAGGGTKLRAGVERIVEALEVVQAQSWLVIDGARGELETLNSPTDLLGLPVAEPTEVSCDIVGLLETAVEHIEDNDVGRAEIWICSDGQASDWSPDDGRWESLREALIGLPAGVRVHLLSLLEPAPQNLAVRLERVVQRRTAEGNELRLDVRVRRASETLKPLRVPLTVVIDGARSVVDLELAGREALLEGFRIPIEGEAVEGWGRLELPADANLADNHFHFVFGQAPLRETLIVAEDPHVAEYLRIAAEAPVDPDQRYAAVTLGAEPAPELDLEGIALLVWQGQLPAGDRGALIEAWVARGGAALFLPPARPSATRLFDMQWGSWSDTSGADAPATPVHWRGDGDLLRHGLDGRVLPVGELGVRRLCALDGEGTRLATCPDDEPLLVRATTDAGGAWFLATWPDALTSDLGSQGVVLLALVHRAMETSERQQRSTAQQEAGKFSGAAHTWRSAGDDERDLQDSARFLRGGILTDGERLVALNRGPAEDEVRTLAPDELLAAFAGVNVVQVTDAEDAPDSLVEEIWRLLFFAMLVGLLAEAALCLGERSQKPEASA